MRDFKSVMRYGDLTGQTYNGTININSRQLDSLKGSPTKVEGSFFAYNNSYTSLEFGPKEVKGVYMISKTKITSLEHAVEKCDVFNCRENPQLLNQREQIIKYKIRANIYITDEGDFYFKDIKKDFDDVGKLDTVKRKGFRTLLGLDK